MHQPIQQLHFFLDRSLDKHEQIAHHVRKLGSTDEWMLLTPSASAMAGYEDLLSMQEDELLDFDFFASHVLHVSAAVQSGDDFIVPCLNNKQVVVTRGEIHTGKGFRTERTVRIIGDAYVVRSAENKLPPVVLFTDDFLVPLSFLEPKHEISKQTVPVPPARRRANSVFSMASLRFLAAEVHEALFPQLEQLTYDFLQVHLSQTTSEDEVCDYETFFADVDAYLQAGIDAVSTLSMDLQRRLLEVATDDEVTGAVESYLLESVYELVFFRYTQAYRDKDAELGNALASMKQITLLQLNMPEVSPTLEKRIADSVREFNLIGLARSPLEKLHHLVTATHCLAKDREALGGDALIPMLMCTLVRTDLVNIESNIAFIRRHSSRETRTDSGEFALSTLAGVCFYALSNKQTLAAESDMFGQVLQAVKEGKSLQTLGELVHGDHKVLLARCSQYSESLPFLALRYEQYTLFKSLLSCELFDADFLYTDENARGDTLLCILLQHSQTELVPLLLNRLSEGTPRTDGSSALDDYVARSITTRSVVGLPAALPMLRVPWEYPVNGSTLLWRLSRSRSTDALLAVFNAYKQLDARTLKVHIDRKKGRTLLHTLTEPKLLRKVLGIAAGDSTIVNAQDSKGNTPLMHHIIHRHTAAVLCLLEDPAVRYSVTNRQGLTAVHLAATLGLDADRSVLKALTERSKIPLRAFITGDTPMHTLAKRYEPSNVWDAFLEFWSEELEQKVDVYNNSLEQPGIPIPLPSDESFELSNKMAFHVVRERFANVAKTPLQACVLSAYVEEDEVLYAICTVLPPSKLPLWVFRSQADFDLLHHSLVRSSPATWLPECNLLPKHLCLLSMNAVRSVLFENINRLDMYLSHLISHMSKETELILHEFLTAPGSLEKAKLVSASTKAEQAMSEHIHCTYSAMELNDETDAFLIYAQRSLVQLEASYAKLEDSMRALFAERRKHAQVLELLYLKMQRQRSLLGTISLSTLQERACSDYFLPHTNSFFKRIYLSRSLIAGMRKALERAGTLFEEIMDVKDECDHLKTQLDEGSKKQQDIWGLSILTERRERQYVAISSRYDVLKKRYHNQSVLFRYAQTYLAGELSSLHESRAQDMSKAILWFAQNNIDVSLPADFRK
ncbi:hypothetical protein SJAG_01309 [Schizosaccharomyces japonicus yFS275]|uniref:VPS9 domain-containing protein n=1 Tax=Schizosaccharomyces japonicus (strain yFS275 / FY16936) TaxID=402676 RepID=B6K0B5_SCHJY|nr:hypothetical protein SJAG_01309 [Schizosaccharomyces japonicus yFS275]EEB06265.1 hypothetical protein SJAG_01309 [Schizosaccharomyces japonicus yFS275]